MLLAIDIGNTNIVTAAVDSQTEEVLFVVRVDTDKSKSVDEYIEMIHEKLDPASKKQMKEKGVDSLSDAFCGGVIVSSVPAVTDTVQKAFETIIGKSLLRIGPGIKADVDLGIPDPSSLGPDLLVGAVAGLHKYQVPMIIFDMGTCTTISVIDKNSRFLGGAIAPGAYVSKVGMMARASHLPEADLVAPPQVICGDTVEAIQSGVIVGHAAMTDGMIERIWEELGYETTVIATGGLADVVAPLCKKPVILDSQMNIRGLLLLYHMNQD